MCAIGEGDAVTSVLENSRALLLDGLRDALAGSSSLSRIVRQHVGIEDAAGGAVDGAGKLLRPSLVLFVAEELGARRDEALPAAVALELVHNFSLVHDDIQDRDRTRRGRPTLWAAHGEAMAINAGDLLHAIASREAARCGSAVTACLAEATIDMVEGQSLDLSFERRFVTIDEYMAMIDRKTGALLRCAFELGGIVAGADDGARRALRDVGIAAGRAFQIRDDVLGIWGDGDVVGKPQGSDIVRRKKAFPVVSAFGTAGPVDKRRMEDIYLAEPVAETDMRWMIRLMERLDVPAAAAVAVREALAQAVGCVGRIPLSATGRGEVDALIEYLAGRTK
jgi:geranylgeranyl diphosphate synthase type I